MHLPVNRIPACAKAVDQHQQLGRRLKHFCSFGTDPLRQSRENKHRGSLSAMIDLQM